MQMTITISIIIYYCHHQLQYYSIDRYLVDCSQGGCGVRALEHMMDPLAQSIRVIFGPPSPPPGPSLATRIIAE